MAEMDEAAASRPGGRVALFFNGKVGFGYWNLCPANAEEVIGYVADMHRHVIPLFGGEEVRKLEQLEA